MSFKLAIAGLAFVMLGACQGIAPKSAEAVCEEAGSARGTDAFDACVGKQRQIAAERRRVSFRRTHRGPSGR